MQKFLPFPIHLSSNCMSKCHWFVHVLEVYQVLLTSTYQHDYSLFLCIWFTLFWLSLINITNHFGVHDIEVFPHSIGINVVRELEIWSIRYSILSILPSEFHMTKISDFPFQLRFSLSHSMLDNHRKWDRLLCCCSYRLLLGCVIFPLDDLLNSGFQCLSKHMWD